MIILSLRVDTPKNKILIIEVKKHVLMKTTTSLYFVIQRCQVHEIFVFIYFITTQWKKTILEEKYVKSLLLF